jgi:hypothetical protein
MDASMLRGKDVLMKNSPHIAVILQDIDEDCFYSYSVASSYARLLGLEIEEEKGRIVEWRPSESEQT